LYMRKGRPVMSFVIRTIVAENALEKFGVYTDFSNEVSFDPVAVCNVANDARLVKNALIAYFKADLSDGLEDLSN
jgi:hypothetical protein